MHDQIRRAIDDAFNRGGMTVGLPKVTVDASQLKHLLDIADAQRVRIAEMEALVRRAYLEGHADGSRREFTTAERQWEFSEARAALEGE